ncbi:hypothetical protein F3K34_44345 [Streptomyces sp. LBUM 1486]|uniref:hypothetical protein n=1 Tax=Streptomyces scabiei TaxID=1930 RepID=UPI001B337E70|nr:hypothetical protein [Streptomyces sp. LBUM 1486]MBP5918811.1 hypothetical protein [Streptomyces sp. LBUM 1486]
MIRRPFCTYCGNERDDCRPSDGACPLCVPLVTAAGVFGAEGLAAAQAMRDLIDSVRETIAKAGDPSEWVLKS